MRRFKMKRQLAKKVCVACSVALLLGNSTVLSAFATAESDNAQAVTVSENASVSGNNSENASVSGGNSDSSSVSGGDSSMPGGAGMPGGPGGPGGGQDTGTLVEDRIMDVVINVGATESEVSVTWYTNGETQAKLQLAKAEGSTDGFPSTYTEYTATSVKAVYEDYYSNSVTLKGLERNTAYVYRVSGIDEEGNTIWSDVYNYHTQNAAEGFGFLVAGDPQIGSGKVDSDTEGWVNTMTMAVNKFSDVSFLLSVGDQVNSASGNSLANEYQGFLADGAMLSSIPFAPSVGNHDSNTITSYVTHNTLPNMSSYGSSSDEVTGDEDYSFRYGNTIFMMLNTNNSSIAEHKAFIEETIANNQDAAWRVVAFHQSIYSVARHVNDGNIAELRTGLSPVFVENDIDVVLMGHDHVYARSYIMGGETGMTAEVQTDEEGNALSEITDPDGVQYVTFNSASGSKYYDITNELFEYTAVQSQEKTPNYSYVSVDEDSFVITTYRSTDNSVVDTVAIYKTTDDIDNGTDAGDNGTDAGDNGTDAGDNGTDAGDNSTDAGDNSTDAGDNGTDAGDNSTDAGDNSTDAGDNSTDTGDNSTDAGDNSTDADDNGTDAGDDSTGSNNTTGSTQDNSSSTVSGEETVNSEAAVVSASPKTGDSSKVVWIIALMILFGTVVAADLRLSKKTK